MGRWPASPVAMPATVTTSTGLKRSAKPSNTMTTPMRVIVWSRIPVPASVSDSEVRSLGSGRNPDTGLLFCRVLHALSRFRFGRSRSRSAHLVPYRELQNTW
jgi:hypothetical protein